MTFRYKRVLVIGDNAEVLEKYSRVFKSKRSITQECNVVFGNSPLAEMNLTLNARLPVYDLKTQIDQIVESFDLIISAHCKQIFPKDLIRTVKCMNIHPGYNPYNRGWYPHVFSIVNGKPAGVTIHEMDEEIDHGPIIVQQKVPIYSYDTSMSLYRRIIDLGEELLSQYIETILRGEFEAHYPLEEGNINTKSDYEKLRCLNLRETYQVRHILNLMRALSHGDYRNGYFVDDQGKKVFFKLELQGE